MLGSLRAKSATMLGRTCLGILVAFSHWQGAACGKCGLGAKGALCF